MPQGYTINMKKVLILHTSVGLGHKTIAENIAYHLRRAGMTVETADILSVESGPAASRGVSLYGWIQRQAPWIWDFLYSSKVVNGLLRPFRLLAAARHSDRTCKLIENFNPDLVIATQTTASAIVAYLKKKKLYRGPFAIAFSDFHYHDFWRYDEADYYIVNIPEQRDKLIAVGVSPERISICGMSIKDEQGDSRDRVLKKLNIPDHAKVILVGSGSQAVVFPWGVADKLMSMLEQDQDAYLLFLTGSNKELFEKLSERYNNARVRVLSYYQPLDELYKITDLFITKPGGLSVAEALSYNLPMIITHALPGQEALNIDYLLKNGLIIGKIQGEDDLEGLLRLARPELNFQQKLVSHPLKATILGQEKSGQAKVLVAVQNMLDVKLTTEGKVN